MLGIKATQCDHPSKVLKGSLIILEAMLIEIPLHQKGLGISWFNIENSVKKDLSGTPTFFGEGSRRVTPINPDDTEHRCIRVATHPAKTIKNFYFHSPQV